MCYSLCKHSSWDNLCNFSLISCIERISLYQSNHQLPAMSYCFDKICIQCWMCIRNMVQNNSHKYLIRGKLWLNCIQNTWDHPCCIWDSSKCFSYKVYSFHWFCLKKIHLKGIWYSWSKYWNTKCMDTDSGSTWMNWTQDKIQSYIECIYRGLSRSHICKWQSKGCKLMISS